MDTPFGSPAEQPRLRRLAAAVPASGWIAVPVDPDASVSESAARAGTARVLCGVDGNPVPAIQRLTASGLRARVHLASGSPLAQAAGWRVPVRLLCLPARSDALPALFSAWGRHVPHGGHVLFFGGLAPPPRRLGVNERHWTAHEKGGGLFLLTRRPFG